MGFRQKVKSEQTKQDLKETAISLFLQKGYEETTIQEIADKSGYSVGSVYRKWSGKQSIFMEIWNEYIYEFIKGTISGFKNGEQDKDRLIDFLLDRSETFAKNPMTMKLYITSQKISATNAYEGVSDGFRKYSAMLYDFIKGLYPDCDEEMLKTATHVIHCVLNADAMKNTGIVSPVYYFERASLKKCLQGILDLCGEKRR